MHFFMRYFHSCINRSSVRCMLVGRKALVASERRRFISDTRWQSYGSIDFYLRDYHHPADGMLLASKVRSFSER